jgi:hypothetical protein
MDCKANTYVLFEAVLWGQAEGRNNVDALIFKLHFVVYEFSLGSREDEELGNNLRKRTWRICIISKI